jgi:O-antigen/teichoic acid export membrane protein
LSALNTTIPSAGGGWFAKLLRNRTFNHSLQINALRAVSLGIGFLGSVWASRCLGPEKLGISGMIVGTVAPLILIINLNQTAHFIRLYRSRATEADRDDLVSIISTYKIAACLIVMLVAVPLLLLGHFSSLWYLGLAAGFPYFFLMANVADWLLQSQDKIPAITRAVAIQAVVTTSLYFLFFRPGMSAGADLVIQDIGLSVSLTMAWYTALRGRKLRLFQWSKLRLIVPILQEGRWLIAVGCAVYIFTSLDQPLVGWLYSLKEVGIYRTSIVLVGGVGAFPGYLPMLLYPRMLEWHQIGPHHLWERQKKVLIYFGLFVVFLSSCAFLLAPLGYHYIYGPAFQRGAYPFALLLSAKLMAAMSGILGWGMVAQKKDRTLFTIMVYVAIFSLGSNLFLIPRFGALAASGINLLSEILMFVLIFTHNQRALSREEVRPEQEMNLKTPLATKSSV